MPEFTKTLICRHSAGIYSNFSVRLEELLQYYNKTKELPDEYICSDQFGLYKNDPSEDFTELLWKPERKDIDIPEPEVHFTSEDVYYQFCEYKGLNFDKLNPFLQRYFSPTDLIIRKVQTLINKYRIDTDNTCAIFYRGNDKITETARVPYEDFINRAKQIKYMQPNIKFLVLPDETEFLEAFKAEFPDALCMDETGHIRRNDGTAVFYQLPRGERGIHLVWYVATVILVSQCKYIITHSGNGGLWAALYRGHAEGLMQWRNGAWV